MLFFEPKVASLRVGLWYNARLENWAQEESAF